MLEEKNRSGKATVNSTREVPENKIMSNKNNTAAFRIFE